LKIYQVSKQAIHRFNWISGLWDIKEENVKNKNGPPCTLILRKAIIFLLNWFYNSINLIVLLPGSIYLKTPTKPSQIIRLRVTSTSPLVLEYQQQQQLRLFIHQSISVFDLLALNHTGKNQKYSKHIT
jgi:hypothetical protein